MAELQGAAGVSHANLVQMKHCCWEKELMLVLEFFELGSAPAPITFTNNNPISAWAPMSRHALRPVHLFIPRRGRTLTRRGCRRTKGLHDVLERAALAVHPAREVDVTGKGEDGVRRAARGNHQDAALVGQRGSDPSAYLRFRILSQGPLTSHAGARVRPSCGAAHMGRPCSVRSC